MLLGSLQGVEIVTLQYISEFGIAARPRKNDKLPSHPPIFDPGLRHDRGVSASVVVLVVGERK